MYGLIAGTTQLTVTDINWYEKVYPYERDEDEDPKKSLHVSIIHVRAKHVSNSE